MALHSLRFAQAGNLRLNQPLRGVGPLADAARSIAESAPTRAWERLVAACIEHDVDFLLLTPQTLSGPVLIDDRRTLLAGFRRLAEANLPVFWAISDLETPNVIPDEQLPDNVTLLSEHQRKAALSCDGRTLVEFTRGDASPDHRHERPDVLTLPGEQPLRILIPDMAGAFDDLPSDVDGKPGGPRSIDACHDYIACWGAAQPQSRKIGTALAADAGTPQGRSSDESGGSGISIVDWHTGRIADVLRVPTASVRWERCRLVISPETTRADLIERLQFSLIEREAAIGEWLWIVHWQIAGSGPCLELLLDADARAGIEQAVESAFGDRTGLVRVHRWEVRQRTAAATHSVSAMLQEWLSGNTDTAWPSVKTTVAAEMKHANVVSLPDGLPQFLAGDVREEAEHLMAGWLATAARDAG